MTGRFVVSIDDDLCAGHGRCYDLAPAVFASDEDGNGVVLRDRVGGPPPDDVRRAVASCPERAVRLVADSGGDPGDLL